MTAIPQATAIDGYRWLKNDIIRGVYQPDEKLRMSLLTSRYELGVGPLREALSQLVAERLVTVVNQKGYRVAPMSEQELLDIFDARANMEAMLVRLAIERGGDEWEAELLARAHLLNKLESCDASERLLDEWDQRHQAVRSGGALPFHLAAHHRAVGGDAGRQTCSTPDPAGRHSGARCRTSQRADARALTDPYPDYSTGDGWQAVAAGRVSQMVGLKLRVWRHAPPRRTGVEKSYP